MMRLGIDENGEFHPKPENDPVPPQGVDEVRFKEALQWLKRPAFMTTARFRALQWKARKEGARRELLEWLDATLKRLHGLGIPAHAAKIVVTDQEQAAQWVMGRSEERTNPHVEGRAVELHHSVRGRELPPVAWEVFRAAGTEAADMLGHRVLWQGPGKPYLWILEGDQPDQAETHQEGSLSRSPPGEREHLEREHGLRSDEPGEFEQFYADQVRKG